MAALLAIAALCWCGSREAPPTLSDTVFVEKTSFGQFDRAARITLGPQGWVYVVDAGGNAVQVFKSLAAPAITVGGFGWTPFSFDDPTGAATDGLNLYVADRGNHRIQRFDRNLNFISTLFTRDTAAAFARFGYPAGVALSRLGDLFILDGENVRALKFSQQSTFERAFGEIDAEGRKLRRPVKILLSARDQVFILEPDRLLEFDYFGNYVRTIGSGIFYKARGFCLTERGLLVAEPDTLYWLTEEGALSGILPVSKILSSGNVAPVEDVAMGREGLYVLNTKKVYVFEVVGKN